MTVCCLFTGTRNTWLHTSN